jgi:hypothetical protein
LIFIEISLGWVDVALIHFMGNAGLRTYQLLVSPSVVTYLIREQFYNFVPRTHTFEDSLPKRLEYSFYILALKEWNLDSMMYRYLWNPLKVMGKKLKFLHVRQLILIVGPMYIAGCVAWYYNASIPANAQQYIPIAFAFIALVMVLKSFTERHDVQLSWVLIIVNHFWIALAISFNEHFTYDHTVLYLSGIVTFGVLGFICLRILKALEKDLDLNRFHGHVTLYPGIAFTFLICCLSVAGFPITPSFIGEDLIFSHIKEDQLALAFFVALSFIIDGLAIIRIYARLFLGPHVKSVYESAYRSS